MEVGAQRWRVMGRDRGEQIVGGDGTGSLEQFPAAHDVQRYQDASGRSAPVSRVLHGLVALDQGWVRTAARTFTETGVELRSMSPAWSYVSAVGLTLALAMAGDSTSARQVLTDAELQRRPALVFREPDLVLARAWVAREREIVSLAARGLSNRAIAERLVVWVRTVENHLYRACAKLGTTDRSELAALLRG